MKCISHLSFLNSFAPKVDSRLTNLKSRRGDWPFWHENTSCSCVVSLQELVSLSRVMFCILTVSLQEGCHCTMTCCFLFL